jgi:hypothetical protein
VVFGPHPRDYRQDIPKKVRQLARRSALNARAREGALLVVDSIEFEAPKTARLAGLLEAIGLDGKKVLILTHGVKRPVYLSGRNLPTVDVMPYLDAAAYDVLWAEAVVVEQAALSAVGGVTVEPLAESPARARKRSTKAKAAAKPAKKAPAKKAARPKAAAKERPAERKPKKPAPKRKGSE